MNNNYLLNFILVSIILTGLLSGFIFSNTTKISKDLDSNHLELNEIMQKFKTAIIEKDTLSFDKLFFDEEVSFVGIMSELTEASIKKDYPDFQGVSVSNSSKFIREVSTSANPQEERSYNPVIETDGIIASISFDYSFHSGGRLIQWGHEKWNLVLVENEWLITNVIFSIHFPDIEPFPFLNNKKP